MSASSSSLTDALTRQARPRVVAALVRAFRDVDLAEDLFQEACLRAVKNWPARGRPDDPIAWLIRVGRNVGIDRMRKQSRQSDVDPESVLDANARSEDAEARKVKDIDEAVYRDDVLRLIFMCCHEDLSQTDQLALALKVVVGFSVAEVAAAFLVRPDAMERRITRAKKRAAGVATALDTPGYDERARRLKSVSTMVYLLFNEGYASSGDAHMRQSLSEEAIRLARLLLEMFPSQAEVMGLLALCLLQHSRAGARQSPAGDLVPLAEQDRTLWDKDLIAEGRVLVEKALRLHQAGPFQVQAAIAAVHCAAEHAEETDWAEIDRLYAALETIEPSPVVTLNRSVAVEKTKGAVAALELIEPLSNALARYRPYHAARGAFLETLQRPKEAISAFEAALDCSPSDAEAVYLTSKIADLQKNL